MKERLVTDRLYDLITEISIAKIFNSNIYILMSQSLIDRMIMEKTDTFDMYACTSKIFEFMGVEVIPTHKRDVLKLVTDFDCRYIR